MSADACSLMRREDVTVEDVLDVSCTVRSVMTNCSAIWRLLHVRDARRIEENHARRLDPRTR
jgi:hypothetical protein